MRTIRVLVVDDSAFNRRTITKMLDAASGIEVIGYASDGEEALRKVFDLKPDLITLDLEMPRMDGFTFLRIIMQKCPTPVIVVSARSEDENVFRALEFGAVEFVAKPSTRISPELVNIREGLVQKVYAAVGSDMTKVLGRSRAGAHHESHSRTSRLGRSAGSVVDGRARLVVIGSSTGGPPALQKVFTDLDRCQQASFAVAQHMPPGFTKAFADRLNRFCHLEIREAQNGDLLSPGQVLIAPGGKNMTLSRQGGHYMAHIHDPEPHHRYIPSVDVLFESASRAAGAEALGVVLTGMGNDGATGVQRIKEGGGQVLAESEETSVVYGMPKEAVATGSVDRELPLGSLGNEILLRCGG